MADLNLDQKVFAQNFDPTGPVWSGLNFTSNTTVSGFDVATLWGLPNGEAWGAMEAVDGDLYVLTGESSAVSNTDPSISGLLIQEGQQVPLALSNNKTWVAVVPKDNIACSIRFVKIGSL